MPPKRRRVGGDQMSQLLQSAGGVEFWECLNCVRVRRITERNFNTIFMVPPEFCSVRCMNEYMHVGSSSRRNALDQLTLQELPDAATG